MGIFGKSVCIVLMLPTATTAAGTRCYTSPAIGKACKYVAAGSKAIYGVSVAECRGQCDSHYYSSEGVDCEGIDYFPTLENGACQLVPPGSYCTPLITSESKYSDSVYQMAISCNGGATDSPAVTDTTCWLAHIGKYSSGYAGGIGEQFSLEEAKNKCIDLGESKCKAVTCDLEGQCTVRASATLISSLSKMETTYVQDACSSVESGVTTTAPPPVTGTTCWLAHTGKYSSGHAGGIGEQFSLEEAKNKCIDLGESKCKAVTCDLEGQCTVRASATLSSSPSGETTYVQDACSSGESGVTTTAPPVTGTTCWSTHNDKYSEGHAGGISEEYSLQEAKNKCIDLGLSTCKAITCNPQGKCTVRASASLSSSPNGATTYVPDSCTSGIGGVTTLSATTTSTLTTDVTSMPMTSTTMATSTLTTEVTTTMPMTSTLTATSTLTPMPVTTEPLTTTTKTMTSTIMATSTHSIDAVTTNPATGQFLGAGAVNSRAERIMSLLAALAVVMLHMSWLC